MKKLKKNSRVCLNCGVKSAGHFCPECGQSLATERFTMRSFGVHLVSSLTRVSGAFLRTSWGLLWHPWEIVRNYIYGKRAGLVSPVSMLLLLSLYWGIMMAVVPYFNHSDQLENLELSAGLKWLYGSITLEYLFLAIPIAVGTWAVYRRDMRGRFNFTELIIATLYLASTFLLVDFILSPIELLNERLGNALIIIVTGLYGILCIFKAFPQPTSGKAVLKLAILTALCGFLLLVFLMLIAFPLYSDLL